MPGPFTITPSSALITLEENSRQSNVSFTVTNTLSRRLRATARLVVPAGSPAGEWLSIMQPNGDHGAAELPGTVRTFDLGETETYQVRITAPTDAQPATYTFRLVVADETNPDDQFTESADVSFVLKEKPVVPPPPPRKFPLWIIPVIVVLLVVVGIIIVLLTRDGGEPPPPTVAPPPSVTPLPLLNIAPGFAHFGITSMQDDFFLGSDPVVALDLGLATLTDFEAVGGDSFGNVCGGFITAAPTLAFEVFDQPSAQLTFFFSGISDDTMIVLDPQGRVYCNDDTLTNQPAVTVDVEVGMYYVWIGSKRMGSGISGQLLVSSDCSSFSACNP